MFYTFCFVRFHCKGRTGQPILLLFQLLSSTYFPNLHFFRFCVEMQGNADRPPLNELENTLNEKLDGQLRDFKVE